MRTAIAIAAALILGACSTYPGQNMQGFAGINHADIQLEDGLPVNVRITGGKESQEVSVRFKLPNDLEASYTAKDVRAFDGQAFRAAVDEAQTEAQSSVVKEVLPILSDALLRAFGVP